MQYNAQFTCVPFLLQLIMLMDFLPSKNIIRFELFTSPPGKGKKRQVFKFPSIQTPFCCASQWVMVGRLVGLIDEYRILFWFASLASMPGLYRKKCKACQHDSCFGLLPLLACLGCTERSVRLASRTITSTPTSV